MRILNAYAGLGGNRKLWSGHDVVAIESNPKIAAVYKKLYPGDEVIVTDAHQYIFDNHYEFDFIWSSPPCQSHSVMVKASRHKPKSYPDMSLYQQIIFLQNFFKGSYVVENVKPYYEPLIKPSQKIGRHLFWSNFEFDVDDVKRPHDFINMSNMAGRQSLMDWLDIHFEEKIYYDGNHCPAQVLRNCVHPNIGRDIISFVENKL